MAKAVAYFFFRSSGTLFDVVEFAVEILEAVDHGLVPESARFEIADEELVQDDEVAGQIALHIEIPVGGLDTGQCCP